MPEKFKPLDNRKEALAVLDTLLTSKSDRERLIAYQRLKELISLLLPE